MQPRRSLAAAPVPDPTCSRSSGGRSRLAGQRRVGTGGGCCGENGGRPRRRARKAVRRGKERPAFGTRWCLVAVLPTLPKIRAATQRGVLGGLHGECLRRYRRHRRGGVRGGVIARPGAVAAPAGYGATAAGGEANAMRSTAGPLCCRSSAAESTTRQAHHRLFPSVWPCGGCVASRHSAFAEGKQPWPRYWCPPCAPWHAAAVRSAPSRAPPKPRRRRRQTPACLCEPRGKNGPGP